MEVLKSKFPIYGVADSAIGGRPENQDAWGCIDTPLGFLVVVCDGMGGGPGGRLASYVAKDTFIRLVCEAFSEQEPRAVLRNAEFVANDALFREMEKNPSLRGMGTTLVAVLINQNAAYVLHCGDSRFYKLRRNSIVYRTRDHSFVEGLVHNGTFTEEQARLSNQANVLTRAIGNNGNATPDVVEVPYERGDRFVLCTDGVWGAMPSAELVKQMTQKNDICAICDLLQQQVDVLGQTQKDGKHDNHTLAIIELKTDSNLKEEMSRKTLNLLIALIIILVLSILLNIVLILRPAPAETNDVPVYVHNDDIPEKKTDERSPISPEDLIEYSKGNALKKENKTEAGDEKADQMTEEDQKEEHDDADDSSGGSGESDLNNPLVGFVSVKQIRAFFQEILDYNGENVESTKQFLDSKRSCAKDKIKLTAFAILNTSEKKDLNNLLDAKRDPTKPGSPEKMLIYNTDGKLNQSVIEQTKSILNKLDAVEKRISDASNKE